MIEGGASPAELDVLDLVIDERERRVVRWYASRAAGRTWAPAAVPELAAHLGVELAVAREVVRRLVRAAVLDSCSGLSIRVCTRAEVLETVFDRALGRAIGARLLMELGAHLNPCAPLPCAPEPTTSSDDNVRSNSRKADS
ncbi:MAG: hypothetical protein KC586_17560 [Myxococcales bacterium]|nr:hypothetical protein [Myxococcales bacterium]